MNTVLKTKLDENKIRTVTTIKKYDDGAFGVFTRRVNEHDQPVNSKGEVIKCPEITGVSLRNVGSREDLPKKLLDTLDSETISNILLGFATTSELRMMERLANGERVEGDLEETKRLIMQRFIDKNYPTKQAPHVSACGVDNTIRMMRRMAEDKETQTK